MVPPPVGGGARRERAELRCDVGDGRRSPASAPSATLRLADRLGRVSILWARLCTLCSPSACSVPSMLDCSWFSDITSLCCFGGGSVPAGAASPVRQATATKSNFGIRPYEHVGRSGGTTFVEPGADVLRTPSGDPIKKAERSRKRSGLYL